MLAAEVIAAKQRGAELPTETIHTFVAGFTAGQIPDYQMAALLMAIFFQGLTDREGRDFLQAMIRSGNRMDLTSLPGIKVDKHSTGGVGDKTSLIVAPIVAAADIPVPMISGRALGHTGGTLDKLESIPNFNVRLSVDEFKFVLAKTGCAFGAQTDDIVPADRKLYALRDVTATVAIRPLIAASILSKKIAEGANALVMDVKIGSGGFLPDESAARELAHMLVNWSADEHVTTVALGTDMSRPLGKTAGNAPEVMECLEILRTGEGEQRLLELSLTLAAHMVVLGNGAKSFEHARARAQELLASGAAYRKFTEIAAAQGVGPHVFGQLQEVRRPRHSHELLAPSAGFVQAIAPREIGLALVDLGAGRTVSSDPVDHTAGIYFRKDIGDNVQKNEPIATIVWSDKQNPVDALNRFAAAYTIGTTPPRPQPLIRFICDRDGTRSLSS